MPAIAEPKMEVSQLNRVQKLAAVLVILGPETAGQILKDLDESQVTAVTAAMAVLPPLNPELQNQLLQEFSALAVDAVTAVRGSVEIAQGALERAVGSTRAAEILDQVAPGRTTKSAIQQFAEKEARQIVAALKSEHPQTAALVVSHLAPKKATEVLALFADELREQIVERVALLQPTPVEVVEVVGRHLLARVGVTAVRNFSHLGGVQPTATFLNAMPKNDSQAILAALESRNPDLTAAIRNQMFTFDDLMRLDVAALQKVLREVDSRALAVGLKSASDRLRAHLLSGLSKRAAESVQEEMGFLGKIKPKEIEMAQLGIIGIVRRLEGAGEIELADLGAAENA